MASSPFSFLAEIVCILPFELFLRLFDHLFPFFDPRYRACALRWHPDRHNGSSKVLIQSKHSKFIFHLLCKIMCHFSLSLNNVLLIFDISPQHT
jgi:hypothetical protein